MSYRLELETRAVKELSSIPKDRRELIVAVLDDLQKQPRPPGAKKLSGVDGCRVRKGDSRALFTTDDSARLVRVYRIGHRREGYRR